MKRTDLKKNTRFDSLKGENNTFKARREQRREGRGRGRGGKYSRERRPSRFLSNQPPKKIIFNLETSNFPELGNKQDISTTQNIQDFSHIKNIKDPKPPEPTADELKEGWIRFAKIDGSWYKEEYINPEKDQDQDPDPDSEKILPLRGVLERFQKRRFMLNEVLGDISPYWGKIYEFDSDYESDSENQ